MYTNSDYIEKQNRSKSRFLWNHFLRIYYRYWIVGTWRYNKKIVFIGEDPFVEDEHVFRRQKVNIEKQTV